MGRLRSLQDSRRITYMAKVVVRRGEKELSRLRLGFPGIVSRWDGEDVYHGWASGLRAGRFPAAASVSLFIPWKRVRMECFRGS